MSGPEGQVPGLAWARAPHSCPYQATCFLRVTVSLGGTVVLVHCGSDGLSFGVGFGFFPLLILPEGLFTT